MAQIQGTISKQCTSEPHAQFNVTFFFTKSEESGLRGKLNW